MPERARIQIKTVADPETWEDVGSAGLAVPVSLSSNTSVFEKNAIDDYTTTGVTYFCYESADGTWMIKQLDETGNYPVYSYATVANNPTLTSYTLAFADRVTATYGDYSEA